MFFMNFLKNTHQSRLWMLLSLKDRKKIFLFYSEHWPMNLHSYSPLVFTNRWRHLNTKLDFLDEYILTRLTSNIYQGTAPVDQQFTDVPVYPLKVHSSLRVSLIIYLTAWKCQAKSHDFTFAYFYKQHFSLFLHIFLHYVTSYNSEFNVWPS